MKKTTNQAHTELLDQFNGHGYKVSQYKTGDLAIFSYILESKGEALLIDPTLDFHVYENALKKSGSKLKYVVLTHFHADFLSSHMEFGKTPIIMGQKAKRPGLAFEIDEYKSGSSIKLGEVKLTVIHTPGHTVECNCFLLTDRDGKEDMLFSGDTLFFGEVGRPDLSVSNDFTQEDLAGMLFDSLQKLRVLKPNCKLLPCHGSGSSCGKSIAEGNVCTLEKQFKDNYAFQIHSREEFIKRLTSDIAKPPQYYSYDSKLNQQGHKPFESLIKQNTHLLSIEQFKDLQKKGNPVIDTRSNNENLKKGHIKGAYLLAENGGMTTWLGTMFDPKTEFLIFAEKDKIDEISERVTRIGYTIAGFNNFTIDQWKNSGEELVQAHFATIEQMKNTPDKLILDVRGEDEAKKERIEGSLNIPFAKLASNIDKIDKTKKIFVHCRVGLRAKIGESILAQHGIESCALPYKFEQFGAAGLPIIKDQPKEEKKE